MLPRLAPRVGMLVVDEVHCISDWGHDFRPDYRRIGRVLDLLPSDVPVLGTTATANDRVVADVQTQFGEGLLTLRGPLARSSLVLDTIRMPSQAERLAWLATVIPTLPGTGIVYCLTVADAARVAGWLSTQGIAAAAYSGETDPELRVVLEGRLLANEIKVLVATSALGMGYDKPDLAFVVHYQSPGSPIAYYQQVGRAGRALPDAHGVLLSGYEDRDIQDYFIRTAFPPRDLADAVVGLLADARRLGPHRGDRGRGEHPSRSPHRDAQGARGRGRGRQGRHQVPAHLRALGVPRRADRAHHRAAPRRATGDGRLPRERHVPHGAARPRPRRSVGGRVRPMCPVHRPPPQRRGRSRRSWSRPRSSSDASHCRSTRASATPRARRSPTTSSSNPGVPSRTGLTAGGAGSCATSGPRAGSRTSSSTPSYDWSETGHPSRVRRGSPPCRRRAIRSSSRRSRAHVADRLRLPFHDTVTKARSNRPQAEMANTAQQSRNVARRVRGERPRTAGSGAARRRHRRLALDPHRGRRVPAAAPGPGRCSRSPWRRPPATDRCAARPGRATGS